MYTIGCMHVICCQSPMTTKTGSIVQNQSHHAGPIRLAAAIISGVHKGETMRGVDLYIG